MLFLGIDLGTSSIKLVVMDENGEIKYAIRKQDRVPLEIWTLLTLAIFKDIRATFTNYEI